MIPHQVKPDNILFKDASTCYSKMLNNIYLWQGREGEVDKERPHQERQGLDMALVFLLPSRSMCLHSLIKLRNLYVLHG